MISQRRSAFIGEGRLFGLRIPIPAVVLVAVSLGLGVGVVEPVLVKIVLLLALIPLVVALGLWSSTALMLSLATWLVALGLIRRLVDTAGSATVGGFGDPLLLVQPVAMVVLLSIAAKQGAFENRTRLAKAVLALNILALLEVVNPIQGSPLVGAAGLLFLLVPMLSFWVGRSLLDEITVSRLFTLIAVLAIPSVLYGLFQQVYGFPPWDAAWISAVHAQYIALDVGGVIRSFGTFSAASEYVTFLAIGFVVYVATLLKKDFILVSLPALALLGAGIIFESSRTTVVLSVLAICLMGAALWKVRPKRAFVGGVAGVVLLFLVAHSAIGGSTQAASGSVLLQHQLGGLANPLNAQDSTFGQHFSEMIAGFYETVIVPFGHGTGSISIAANTFGGRGYESQLDPSNYGIALGMPGIIAYFVVLFGGFSTAYKVASEQRSWWSLAGLGLLAVTLFQWSNGGQYAVAWLPWLYLGYVDRLRIPKSVELAHESNFELPLSKRPVGARS